MNKINKEIKNSLKSWPFIEAKKIIEKFGGLNNFSKPKKNMFYLKLVMDHLDYLT